MNGNSNDENSIPGIHYNQSTNNHYPNERKNEVSYDYTYRSSRDRSSNDEYEDIHHSTSERSSNDENSLNITAKESTKSLAEILAKTIADEMKKHVNNSGRSNIIRRSEVVGYRVGSDESSILQQSKRKQYSRRKPELRETKQK